MNRLTKPQVIAIHRQIIQKTGGTEGIRDDGLLESALEAPFLEFAGIPLYPTLEEKAARLAYGIAQNHAMVDGNKRLAVHCMLLFLLLNGKDLDYTLKEMETVILQTANHQMDPKTLAVWIRQHEK